MEHFDQRWFIPEVTEVAWAPEKFIELRKWLNGRGLNIIRHWAEQFSDYVQAHEWAPMTERKREMIDGSRSEHQLEATRLATLMIELGRPGAIATGHVVSHCRGTLPDKMYDTQYELRKAKTDAGLIFLKEKRTKFNGSPEYILVNEELNEKLNKIESASEKNQLFRAHIVLPKDLRKDLKDEQPM
jgi:hypothetical protein